MAVHYLVENRHGSKFREAPFLVSTPADLIGLARELKLTQDARTSCRIWIALDAMQLLAAHAGDAEKAARMTPKSIASVFDTLVDVRSTIRSLHVWGRKANKEGYRVSHSGDLSDFFTEHGKSASDALLDSLQRLLSDGIPRYFVPEVYLGSNADLHSIVRDVLRYFDFQDENAGHFPYF